MSTGVGIGPSPAAAPPARPASERERFIDGMLAWLNRRQPPLPVRVEADTPLFENRLIDSFAILEVIAWTEREIGRDIPDREMRMDRFRTVRAIACSYVEETDAAR